MQGLMMMGYAGLLAYLNIRNFKNGWPKAILRFLQTKSNK